MCQLHVLDGYSDNWWPSRLTQRLLRAQIGISIPTAETPLAKRTASILVFSKSKHKLAKRRADCIRRSKCIDACPLDLHPMSIVEAIEKGDVERAKRLYLTDCFECGICSCVCPSGIPLAHTICSARY